MAQQHIRDGPRPEFPFSAVVGNQRAKRALVCALASPDLSSVLICGPKGSGKSVLARSAARITDRGLTVLPLNATDDQVLGGMDLEYAVKEGCRVSSGSILSRSDGGILLAEDGNLLPEHILHQVLNAAETSSNTVERDGVSVQEECSFLLVVTMDPEGGSISDHLLDRFDICVFMSSIEDEEGREEVVRRRMAYERNLGEFRNLYAELDEQVADSISRARVRARYTRVPDGYLSVISEVCSSLGVAGHRGDIAMMNTACALAALDDRDAANLDDLKEAAALCLEHRRNDRQEDPPSPPPEPPNQPEGDEGESTHQDEDESVEQREQEPLDAESSDIPPPSPSGQTKEEVFSVGDAFRVIDYMREEEPQPLSRSGKRSRTTSRDLGGRCIGYRIPRGRIEDVALLASIRAAAPYQILRDHGELAIVLTKDDLRQKVRERRQGNDILFMVDGSGSIGAQRRMVAVKGAILSMLRDAYQKRDSIGMAVFRMDRAEEVLPLTRSIERAYRILSEIPTGGRTPLIHALIKGHEILKESISRGSRPVMVILSDGRCNVPYTQGRKPVEEMLSTARALSGSGISFIVIDTEAGRMRLGLALDLCRALDGTYLRLEDLNAEYIERSVRMAMEERG